MASSFSFCVYISFLCSPSHRFRHSTNLTDKLKVTLNAFKGWRKCPNPAYTQKKYNSREATHNSPGNEEFTLVSLPQLGHALVRQSRITEPPMWGLPSSGSQSSPVNSVHYLVSGLPEGRYVVPNGFACPWRQFPHLPNETPSRMFCTAGAAARPPQPALVGLSGVIQPAWQFEFKTLTASWKGSMGSSFRKRRTLPRIVLKSRDH